MAKMFIALYFSIYIYTYPPPSCRFSLGTFRSQISDLEISCTHTRYIVQYSASTHVEFEI
jgi:hypothetical protein